MFLLLIPTASFILVSIIFITYMYWFQNFDKMSMPEINSNVEHVIVLVHGLGDTTDTWASPLKDILEKNKETGVQTIALDWNPYSQNMFRCSIDGKRIGAKLAEKIIKQKSIKTLHLIGHSCGSFVVLGVCESVKNKRKDVLIQTTFLDPVSIYGGFFWHYGINHFGYCGDFSDAYIDTGDGVPGSNQLLPNAHTFNVTAMREANNSFKKSPHVWPVMYYQKLAGSGNMLEYRKDKTLITTYPRGVMSTVSP